jgi:protein-L-isoaspartate(D-aspartate) O-methyltransferase
MTDEPNPGGVPVTDLAADPPRAEELRRQLVDGLVDEGTIVSKGVETALRAVPRHLFAPEAALEEAYDARNAVVTKRDEHGVALSSVSAAHIQAMMLEQSGLAEGMRALEIGSGGYNAALMAEVTGATGHVTSVDIDADVVARARGLLARTGYTAVRVEQADAENGYAPSAPYDAVIVTVGAWDLPPAWTEQLTEGGTLTVPLRLNGLTRSVAFERVDGHLAARTVKVCGFVPMQGAGAHPERLLPLRGTHVALRFDEHWFPDADRLQGVLDGERVEAWTGVRIGSAVPFDTLQLWLATALDGFGLLSVDPEGDPGPVAPLNTKACPAVVDEASLAYLAVRRVSDDPAEFEFGAHAFGPQGRELAHRVADLVRRWDREYRGGPGPRITAFPADAAVPVPPPPGRVLAKRHARIVLTWP